MKNSAHCCTLLDTPGVQSYILNPDPIFMKNKAYVFACEYKIMIEVIVGPFGHFWKLLVTFLDLLAGENGS